MAKGNYTPNLESVYETTEVELKKFLTSYSAGSGLYDMDGIEKVSIPLVEGVKQDRTYVLKVNGDSMSPKIQDGDTLLIDINPVKYQSGDIVAVCLNEDHIVKVYDPGSYCLYLTSINPNYEPIRVYEEEDSLQILGKVIKIIRDV